MKVEENILREVLIEALNNANTNGKKSIDKFKELIYNMYGFTGGEAIDILNGKTPVELMQNDTMFKVTRVLYELNNRTDGTFDLDKLNVDNYFFQKEQDEFNVKIDRTQQDEDIVIKAGNWMQVEDDQYVIKIYPDELMPYYINRNKINYNPDTQRNLTIKETKTGDIKIITFDEDAYNDIHLSMYNNNYISDMLALNINPDNYAPPKIVRGDLIIPSESQIDCIDGWHRLKAAVTTKLIDKDWNKPLTFFLFVCDVDKAVRYILQQDKKIHLSEEQATKDDKTDAANFIIKDKLNQSNTFYLRNTIDDSLSFSLNKIIHKLFNPKKLFDMDARKEAVTLASTIEKNMNSMIEKNDLYNEEFTKEMWFISLYILKYCIDNNKDFLEIISSINLDNILEQIQFTKQPISKHYKVMSEVVKNV